MFQLDIPGLPVASKHNWLPAVQTALNTLWTMTTGHHARATNGTWACELACSCRTCSEHLSVPCSLLQEANEIGQFLAAVCYTDDPAMFLRLYLILLDEFCAQLADVARLLNVTVPRAPRMISVWTNRWAKHRIWFTVQHHPVMLFADSLATDWKAAFANLPAATVTDMCCQKRPVFVIDCDWLCEARGNTPDLSKANSHPQAVIAVPPFQEFLTETIRYFRSVLDLLLRNPEAIKRFEMLPGVPCFGASVASIASVATSS